MPSVHCKPCGKTFYSIRTLRRHQWTEHAEYYAKRTKPAVKLLEAPKDVETQPIPSVDMSVTELLHKLTAQQMFLHDVVTLIERMVHE